MLCFLNSTAWSLQTADSHGLVLFAGLQDASVLVQWSCILLAQLQLPAAQKASGRILAAQAGPLDALGVRGHCAAATACRTARLLRRRPILVPEYLAAAKATGATSLHMAIGQSALPRLVQMQITGPLAVTSHGQQRADDLFCPGQVHADRLCDLGVLLCVS